MLFTRHENAVSAEACAAWTRGVYAAREEWVHDFDGAQASLGRAWYTHLEQDKTQAYFAGAGESDAVVERHCPGLQACLREWMQRVVGEEIVQRRGFCGPGVHIFPAGNVCAREGGDVHFDTEGLTAAQRAARTPARTLVLMLSPPEAGGELRVWDALYDGHDEAPRQLDACRMQLARYDVGTLVVIDSYRLHQIAPFRGARDRISATCHAARTSRGTWELWF